MRILKSDVGIMQGRLSETFGNKIQFFPKKNWKKEFQEAKKIGVNFIEWTLDYDDFDKNPIFLKSGLKKIKFLKKKYKIDIKTLTGDCFMQRPFWKTNDNKHLLKDLESIIKACSKLKIKFIIFPLVDNSSIKNKKEEKKIINSLKKTTPLLKKSKAAILFESDYHPKKLKTFIKKFDKRYFGINYDTGNSAGLGYNINEEFHAYGHYIKNIHIKDRLLEGKTIRLGLGNADFEKLFINLKKINYKNLLILQTARATNKKHKEEIVVNVNYLYDKLSILKNKNCL